MKATSANAARQTNAMLIWSLTLASLAFSAGCETMCHQWTWCPLCPPPPPCQLPPDVTKSELVQHLNANIENLYSWRSTDVRITGGGMPFKLPSFIVVERPRNFRLMVNSPGGTSEADLGSNSERFWFWSNRNNPKYVLTAAHDRIAQAQQRLRIPFEPEWLMQAMGVIPIDETNLVMTKPRPNAQRAHLVADLITQQNQPVRKVYVVDTCRGVILEQILFDSSGQLIAKATFADHQSH